MANPPGIREADLLFAELVVEQRLCAVERVSECITTLERLARSGVSPLPSLGELLVQKGYLTAPQANETMRRSGAAVGPGDPDAQDRSIPPEAASGGRIGKYAKSRKLGEGAMGEVWKAWDTDLRRWVALKFLKGGDEGEIARFKREAQTAARLSHPNIGAVYEATDEFIAMQFIEGKTLETFPRGDPRALAELIRQAAAAVHFAHEQGVIHRDLKPANIMVMASRGAPSTRRIPGLPSTPRVHAFVMDFGLAKNLGVDSRLSMSGLIVGTPNYMSPEQAQAGAVSPASDVYSLGATLYEMLSGRPPVSGRDVYDVLKKIAEEEPARLPGDLGTISMKCLEKDPRRRYASAADLAEDLGRFLEGESIRAHPPSALYRLSKFVARRRAPVLIAAVGAAALAAALLTFVPRWRAAQAAKLVADREKDRARAREEATKVYEEAQRDLRVLRLRSYRSDWSVTEEEFDEYRGLIRKCADQMERTGDSGDGWWAIGRARQVLGDRAGALEAYSRGISVDPSHGHCLLYKGRLLIETALLELYSKNVETARRDVAEAEDLLERGASSGSVSEIERDLAAGYARIVRDRPAADYGNAMLKKWEGKDFREEFHIIIGLSQVGRMIDILFGLSRSERMIKETTAALKARPCFYEAYVFRGIARHQMGDRDGAIEDYTRAVAIHPRFAEAYNNRGVVLGEKGDREGALADYMRTLKIDPQNESAHMNLAWRHHEMGDAEAALSDLEKLLRVHPRSVNAYLNRAVWRMAKRDYDGAIADSRKALEINPRCSQAFCNRGLARHQKGDLDGAIADYDRAIQIDRGNASAYLNRGVARREKGDLDGAIEDDTRAIDVKTDYLEAYVNRAVARIHKGDFEGAIEDTTRALKIDARSAETYNTRGSARYKKRDFDGAIADLNRAIELDPQMAAAYDNRGMAYRDKGDLDRSIADASEAIRLAPHSPPAYVHRAGALRAKGDLDGAIKDATRAIELNPQCAEAYDIRGAAHCMKGRFDEAIADATKSIGIDPRSAETRVHRGVARYSKGDRAGAAQDWEKALELAPANWPHRAQVQKALEGLKAGQ